MSNDPFEDRNKFQDDVWGQIRLNDLERDVIDCPEFQRLFRTSQLGFVKMVYHTANHTRGAHSIGACFITRRLIDRLNENTRALHYKYSAKAKGLYAPFYISPAERILVRLGALLHDVSHIPLSHDLEIKTHRIPYPSSEQIRTESWYGHYKKHDDYAKNPLLFHLICDRSSSTLARVLVHYSQPFWEMLRENALNSDHSHLEPFVTILRKINNPEWSLERDLLPQLLFHLLIYENHLDAIKAARPIMKSFSSTERSDWHLGPTSLSPDLIEKLHHAWYQPFRHDIIGDTLSADLIDYLTRDPQRLGTQRRVDLHMLSYYALVCLDISTAPNQYRCAIDLNDHKRGTTRTFLINDLFRLLDLRQDIHEKAVVHRVVQSANAMLSRALVLLGHDELSYEDRRPTLEQIAGLTMGQQHALQSEEMLFSSLLSATEPGVNMTAPTRRRLRDSRTIITKIVERRVYRPLVMLSGDAAFEQIIGTGNYQPEFSLRSLAAIVDSAYFSPFLLFVCSVLEKYLQGVFDSEDDLYETCHSLVDSKTPDADLVLAMEQVPSRVIIWTAPYKQLYKDPAVVVALRDVAGKNVVGQIDRLQMEGSIGEGATRERLKTAIEGADNKYAALWHLYVFISDGLFYSGILEKLLRQTTESLPAVDENQHLQRLTNAQALIGTAFRAVWGHWAGIDKRLDSTKEKEVRLQKRSGKDTFVELVDRWISHYKAKSEHPGTWATVDVTHYYHRYFLDPNVPPELKTPCRDNRHKYNVSAHEVWERARAGVKGPESDLVAFLERVGVTNMDLYSESEFREILALYSYEDSKELIELLLSDKGDKDRCVKALKVLWAGSFPGFPMKRVRDVSNLSPFDDTGASIDAVTRRFADAISTLNPNMRRGLKAEMPEILAALQDARRVHGDIVLQDFLERIANEKTLMWNNVKGTRLISRIRMRWSV